MKKHLLIRFILMFFICASIVSCTYSKPDLAGAWKEARPFGNQLSIEQDGDNYIIHYGGSGGGQKIFAGKFVDGTVKTGNSDFGDIIYSEEKNKIYFDGVEFTKSESGTIQFRPDHKEYFDSFDLKKLIGNWVSLDGVSFFKIYQNGNDIILEGDYFPGIAKNGDKVTLRTSNVGNKCSIELYYTLNKINSGCQIDIRYSTNDLLLVGNETPSYSNGIMRCSSISTSWITGKEFKRIKLNPDQQSSITSVNESNFNEIKSSADTKILTLMSPTVQVGDFYHLYFKDFTTQKKEEYKCDWQLPAIKEIITKCENIEGCPALKGQVYKAKLKLKDVLIIDGPEPSGKKEKQWVIVELKKINNP